MKVTFDMDQATLSAKDTLDLIIELRTESGDKLIRETMELEGISSASLMTHDGEATL